MLARKDPDPKLDTRRLSKFSAEPENLHGARNVHRIKRNARLEWHHIRHRIS
jgi:hypothetical protein